MRQAKIKITLIVSTYNWVDALRVSLKSIANQTILPDEVIIADDGSRQDTADLIKEFQQNFPCPLIHVWHEDNGFRLAAIRNKAIVKASGDYIIQVDGDVVLEKHFISDHIRFKRSDCFVSGSRVNTDAEMGRRIIDEQLINISVFSKGLVNKLNGLRFSLLTSYYRFRYKKNKPYYVKGCNMAFWKNDLIAVNGYNEDMTGWGREDSEIAARLMSYGKKRQFLKFGAVEYHIFHPFNSLERESINIGIFHQTAKSGITYCKNGLDKYLKKEVEE